MRIYLYLLAGITSALIGWNIGQIFLTDLGILRAMPEIVLFPCIAISLAIGMVLNEIFISNPTRSKLNFRIARIPILIASALGLGAGLFAGVISQILLLPFWNIPAPIIRTLAWLFIGAAVGLAEGLTWRWHSLEAGDPKRFRQRFRVSLIAAIIASLVAAGIFEGFRLLLAEVPSNFKVIEDPLGFSILGLLLGLAFSISSSPSYLVALRAGAGFEYTGPTYEDTEPQDNLLTHPYINRQFLAFVSDSEQEQIEEGLSIQLPASGKLMIGSSKDAAIFIPGLAHCIAELQLKHREAILKPHPKYYYLIEVNGERFSTLRSISLKHNYVVAFYPQEKDELDPEKVYRFVYYNRFLDPQA